MVEDVIVDDLGNRIMKVIEGKAAKYAVPALIDAMTTVINYYPEGARQEIAQKVCEAIKGIIEGRD